MIGVSINGQELAGDVVVLAMGPWTNQAAEWLPGVPRISGRLGHSVTIKPSSELSPHCFYLTNQPRHGESLLQSQSLVLVFIYSIHF